MGIDFNKYNPIQKPPLKDWKESAAVVLLSEFLKLKKEFGLSLYNDGGVPCLTLNPGMTKEDIGSERWMIVEEAYVLFMNAVDDLVELIGGGKLVLPLKQAGPSQGSESIRVAKPQ